MQINPTKYGQPVVGTLQQRTSKGLFKKLGRKPDELFSAAVIRPNGGWPQGEPPLAPSHSKR